MTPARRILAPCLVALVLALVGASPAVLAAVTATPAGAATSDDLAAARQKLNDARAAANETAAQFSTADHQLEQTRADIAKLQDSIATTKAKVQELREYARQRAVFAYTHPGTSLEALVDATDAVDAARRQQLLDQANQTDNDIAKRLGTLTSQLKNQQSDLERQEHEQAQISDQLDAKLTALRADQQNVEQAVTDLQARLDAEIQIAALVDAQRKADLEAEKAALQQPQQTISSAGPGQIITPPKAGAFQCPVQGAAYSDDYGGPTGHPGIDMFVPTGTVAVAVMGGTVRFVPERGCRRQRRVPRGLGRQHLLLRPLLAVHRRGPHRRPGRGHRAHRHDRQRDRAAPPLRGAHRGRQREHDRSVPVAQSRGVLSRSLHSKNRAARAPAARSLGTVSTTRGNA